MTQRCDRCDQLFEAVRDILAEIVSLTTSQLEIFRQGDTERTMQIDRNLEKAMGEKERRLGALYEHRKEHGINPVISA